MNNDKKKQLQKQQHQPPDISPEELKKKISEAMQRIATNKIGKPRAIKSAQQMLDAFNEWSEWITPRTEDIQCNIPTREGTPLIVNKPEPITIESFCLFAGITFVTFDEYLLGKDGFQDYSLVARLVKDFVTYHTLKRQHNGILTDNAAKFYLVNNSRYQDVKQIEHTLQLKEPPKWLQSGKAIEQDTEDITHEDI